MNEEQNKDTAALATTGEDKKGAPDSSINLKEAVDAIDEQAKEVGAGDRTDAPDMQDLDNDTQK